jgi:hypothetical protein
MAIVILGGLFTSTLLNLFIIPVLYLRLGSRVARRSLGFDEWAVQGTVPASPRP